MLARILCVTCSPPCLNVWDKGQASWDNGKTKFHIWNYFFFSLSLVSCPMSLSSYPYGNSFLVIFASIPSTSIHLLIFLFLFEDLDVSMWRLPALYLISLPLFVSFNLFLAPLFVFNFCINLLMIHNGRLKSALQICNKGTS